MKNKKAFYMAAAAVLAGAALIGCGGETAEEAKTAEPEQKEEKAAEEKEVVVFAAASMTETLTEIGERYREVDPNVKLVFNFDSSGTLKTQIEEGAACDVFVSAGQKQMDQLSKDGEPETDVEGLDLLVDGTRKNLLENEVVLCVAEGNPANVQSFDDLMEKLSEKKVLLAVGNSDVPVGQYTQKIFSYYDVDEEELAGNGSITYGTNVKELTTQIAEQSVDCGIIYSTDAYSAGLESVDAATEEMCGRVIYPAALVKTGEAEAEAAEFLDYLSSGEAAEVFQSVGFQMAEE